MPAIRKTTDLLNNLSEILQFCQNYREPVYVTDEDQKERVVMLSVEAYEELIGKSRNELYQALQAGLDQINNGEYIEEEEMFEIMDNYLRK